jgi:gas vesicle protein
MTRSVEEIRRDSEQSRAQLAATVDRLRDQITDTAEDIRYKVSPEGIKAEVSGFISHKTQGWLDGLKQQAMDNPMQAIAAGTAIAVPALRLARGFPLPLLMIGAGLALSSKTVRDRAAEAAAPGVEKAREVMGETTARAQSLGDGMRRAISDAERQAAGMASEAQDTTSGIADAAGEVASDLKDHAAQTVDAVTGKVRAGIDAASEKAKETIERARSTANDAATAAPAAASKLIRDNAALIGGLGVAIGAILAASLPSTRAEAGVMGKASDRVKRAASTATQSGFEAAKDTVLSAADAVAKSVADADLGKHASRITEDVTERLKEVADDVVTTAFDPSRNPHS